MLHLQYSQAKKKKNISTALHGVWEQQGKETIHMFVDLVFFKERSWTPDDVVPDWIAQKGNPKRSTAAKQRTMKKKIFSDSDRSLPPFVCRSSIALDSTRNIMNKRRKWKNCLPNPEKQRKKFWYIHVQKDNCVLQCVFVMGPPSPQGCEKNRAATLIAQWTRRAKPTQASLSAFPG